MGLMVAAGVATAVSVTTVLESVAVVGAVMSAVGAVTKNKTLSTIGLVLGVVGGVGALASSAIGGSAALFGSADAIGSDTATGVVSAAGSDAASGGVAGGTWDAAGAASDAASGAAGAAPDVVGGLASGLPEATAAATDPAGSLAGAINPATAVNPADALPGGTAASATPTDQWTLASESTNPADAVAPGTSGTPAAGAGTTSPPALPGQAGPGTTAAPAASDISSGVDGGTWDDTPATSSSSNPLSGLLSFANKNPVVALGAMQAGGSFLTGLTSTLTPAQVSALNAQAAANNAAAALSTQQTANLAMPKSVASSAPVTGAPQALVPGAAPSAPTTAQGFINQAPAPSQVTGKTA